MTWPSGTTPLSVADEHLAAERADDVLVARVGLGDHGVVEDVHVGVGDVLDGDEAEQVAVVVGHAQGGGVLVAHEVPCGGEARLGVDARGLAVRDVLDLRGERGDEARLVETEVLEDEGGLTVDGTSTARLVDAATQLVLEIGVADGGADTVCVGVLVPDYVHLADCFCHGVLLVSIGGVRHRVWACRSASPMACM